MILFKTFFPTEQGLGGQCSDTRQCKRVNQYSMCSDDNKCDCINGYTKMNYTCMPGKFSSIRNCKTFKTYVYIINITSSKN